MICRAITAIVLIYAGGGAALVFVWLLGGGLRDCREQDDDPLWVAFCVAVCWPVCVWELVQKWREGGWN